MKQDKSLTEIARFEKPDMIADISGAFSFLSSDYSFDDKIKILEACSITKAYIEKNRRHVKKPANKRVDYAAAYDVFNSICKATVRLGEAGFIRLFKAIIMIEFNGAELDTCRQAREAISKLNLLDKSKIELIECMDNLKITYNPAYVANYAALDAEEYSSLLMSLNVVSKILKRNNKYWLDAICLLCSDLEYNDVELENKYIYYAFTSLAGYYSDAKICIIEPTPFFIRKMLQDTDLINVDTTIVIEDHHLTNLIKSVLDSRRNTNIKVVTLEDYLALLKLGPADVTLMFGNHFESSDIKIRIIETMLNEARGNHTLCYLDSDRAVNKSDSLIHYLLKSSDIQRIDLLPSGIVGATYPQKKTYIKLNFGDTQYRHDIQVVFHRLIDMGNYQALSAKTHTVEIEKEVYGDNPECIRSFYRDSEQERLKKGDGERHAAKVYAFSPEIEFLYTTFPHDDDTVRVRAYVRIGNNLNQRPVVIQETRKEKRSITINKIINWLESNYPYVEIHKKDEEMISVRSYVSDAIRNLYKGRAITVKSFIYVYYEFEKDEYGKNRDFIKMLSNSEIAEFKIDRITTNHLYEFLMLAYKSKQLCTSLSAATGIMRRMFGLAIEKGHCRFNPADSLIIKNRERFEELDEVNNAVGKRFLSDDELIDIAAKCFKNVREGNTIYLAVLLRLFLGIEANIIAALTWNDLISFRSGKKRIFQFRIEKQVGRDGNAVVPLKRIEQLRTIPLPDELAHIVLEVKAKAKSQYNETMGDMFVNHKIISFSDLPKETASASSNVTPAMINKLCKEMLKNLDIPELVVPVPDNQYGIVENDLGTLRGDIYKNTFRHYMVRETDIGLGELNYLLGIAAPNVDYGNYIGCDERRKQISIQKKIDLMYEAIASEMKREQ